MANEGLTLVRDRWYTALTADVSAGVTTLPVVTNTVNGNVLPTPCIIMCGFEQMYATASTATTITVTRGFNSTAAAHAKGATVGQARVAAHHNDMVGALSLVVPGAVARRNLLTNGAVAVGQRQALDAGTAWVNNAYASPDRWRQLFTGTAPQNYWTTSRWAAGGSRYQAFALSQGGTTKFGWFQVLEITDAIALRSQAVSLQARLVVEGSGIAAVRMAVLSWTGTADATSGDPIATWGTSAGGIGSYAAGWTQSGVTGVLVPTTVSVIYELENVTISGSANNVGVFIWCDDTSHTSGVDALYMTDIQLELGTACGPFERRPLVEDLAACQRYFCKTFPLATTPAQNTGSVLGALTYRAAVAGATAQGVRWQFPSRMRTAPTITTYNPSAANSNWRNATDNADSGASSTAALGENGVFIGNAQAAGDAAGEILHVHATAAAEL